MKKIVLVLSAIVAVMAFGQNPDSTTEKPKSKLTPEQRREKMQQRKMKLTGGWVTKPGSGTGKCVFLNAQKRVPSAAFTNATEQLSKLLKINVELTESDQPITIEKASTALLKSGGQAAIFIVDDPIIPTLLVAPESNWAMLNVAKLLLDKPNEEVLFKRTNRESWRVFAQLMGAADSLSVGCVMQPVSSLKDLDNLGVDCFCPEPLARILQHVEAIGIKPYQIVSYKNACLLGWAPPPTNEFQKVFWDAAKAAKAPAK